MTVEINNNTEHISFIEVWNSGDRSALHLYLDEQSITEVAHLIEEHPEQEADIINELSIHRAASTFKILDITTQKRVIQELPPYKTAELLNELPADDRTSFLEELPDNVISELIKTLNPEERKITLSLLGYPEDSVGRLMTPDYIAVKPHWTVLQVLKYIRRVGKDSETIDVIYVINDKHELVDDLRIREFLIVDIETTVAELIDDRFIALKVNDDQSVAAEAFKMNNRVALPVVNDNNILLGIVTIDDILWVAEEEYSEDMTKVGGTEALDEPYLEMPFWKLIGKRATWLVILFIGELLTASAMSFFEDEIKKVIVLNMLVPLIISSGGNSGSQAATLVIQAMAKGEVTIKDAWYVFFREVKSGLVLGGILGLVGFIRTYIWSGIEPELYGSHTLLLALTTAFSVTGVVMWGTLMGSMLPLILKRFKLDPATSSAPFVATIVDVVGIIIYFSFAYIFLRGTLL
jgi:magnesium transporter